MRNIITTLKSKIIILISILLFCSYNLCYSQDTLKNYTERKTNAAINIGFTYQTKDNKNVATKIFELGTELNFSIHIGNRQYMWDGYDSDGHMTGGTGYVNSFINTFRISGLYYQSNEPAFGLLIGDRIISAHSLIPYVIGLNFITNTNFSKYKLIFRPEIGLSFFRRHRLDLMIGLDLPINKVNFKYYNKYMPQLILNYRLLNRINNYSCKTKQEEK